MKRRPSIKWLAIIGVVGAVAVGTTLGLVDAAGASSGAPTPSVAGSSPVTTASFTFSVSVTGLTASAVTVTGSGQADLTDHAVSLAVNLPATVAKLIPGGSASPETIDAVLSGSTVYVKIPSLASTIGEPWISIGLPSKASSALPGVFAKVARALGNVSSIVDFAQAHHATVTSLPSGIVDGVQATGSKIVATVSKKHGTHTVTADVWADTSGRLVQATVTASGGSHGGVGLTATVNVTGYGAPVTITVPPPSEVKAIPLSTIEMLLGNHRGSHAGHGLARSGHSWSGHSWSGHSWSGHSSTGHPQAA
jgi:hypothetical protein